MFKSKLSWVLVGVVFGTVIGAAVIVAGDEPDVVVEGVLAEAAFNTDWTLPGGDAKKADLEKVIEGSCSFKIDVPLSKIRQHMQDAGTIGKVSPTVSAYTANKIQDDDNAVVYKVSQTVTPTKFAIIGQLVATQMNLLVTINKRASKEDAIVVDWTLDGQNDGWLKFSGRIFAADLHTGKTMVLLTTSTHSNYKAIPDRVRLRLVEHYLSKTKDQLAKWATSL